MFDCSVLTKILYENSEKLVFDSQAYSAIRYGFWRAAKASIPAWLTNGCMPLSRYVKTKHPVDFGKTYNGKRIFGDHKTFEGLLIGYFGGAGGGLITDNVMNCVAQNLGQILPPINSLYILTAPLTVQAMDMVESRWKRSKNLAEGELILLKEKIIDHIAWIAIYPSLYCLTHEISEPTNVALIYGFSLLAGGVFHYLTNIAGKKLLKKP
jgi:hypothetical protein